MVRELVAPKDDKMVEQLDVRPEYKSVDGLVKWKASAKADKKGLVGVLKKVAYSAVK